MIYFLRFIHLLVDWLMPGILMASLPQQNRICGRNLFTNLSADPAGRGTLAIPAAGFVRRGLADAEFEMAKIPGYGRNVWLAGRSQKVACFRLFTDSS